MGLNSLYVIYISMRVYVLCSDVIETIQQLNATLTEKKVIKKIYSNEGIFYVLDNVLYRMVEIVDELPSEELKINRGKFMVDKNKIIYKPEHFQLSPNHISETVIIHTYSLPNDNNIQFIIEQHENDNMNEAYFNSDTDIIKYITDTFL